MSNQNTRAPQRTQSGVDIIAQNTLTNATNHVANMMKTFPDLYKNMNEYELTQKTIKQIEYVQNEFKKIIYGKN